MKRKLPPDPHAIGLSPVPRVRVPDPDKLKEIAGMIEDWASEDMGATEPKEDAVYAG